ncbi:tripartite tricarboxylate transporter substrate-binding protein [Falsiroseomonas oryzae]|uniref:tripartite tricarboxylate transporter substrate-binding protein n=1 Tax=Falsiroseomonas oryzae TaxID=2766473 RepID=UPI0022EA8F35|nr:tripartite tricarboxylate transporter substrate-binding protein [Roseomonas sp. MO-31]
MAVAPTLTRRAALAACTLAASAVGRAEASRPPLRLVVPGAPDSPIDTLGRALADAVAVAGNAAPHVENRSVDRGARAIATIEHAVPDGRNLLLFGSGLVGGRYGRDPLPVDPFQRLTAVAQVAREPLVLAVRADARFETIPDVVAAARARGPRERALGGTDALACLVGREMGRLCGAHLAPTLQESSANMIYDIEAGLLLAGWLRPSALPVTRRQIRLLAVSARRRSVLWPDVPAAQELGAEGLDLECWTGVFGPAGMPLDAVARTYRMLEDAFASWRLRGATAALAMEAELRPGEQLLETMRRHDGVWAAAQRAEDLARWRPAASPP